MKLSAKFVLSCILATLLASCVHQSSQPVAAASKSTIKDPAPPVVFTITCQSLVLGRDMQTSIDGLDRKPTCGLFQDKHGYQGPLYRAAGRIVSKSATGSQGSGNSLFLTSIALYQHQIALADLPTTAIDGMRAPSDVKPEIIETGLTTKNGGPVLVSRFTDVKSETSMLCVSAPKVSSQMTPIQATVCKSVAQNATHDELSAIASRIAIDDIEQIDIRL